MIQGIPRKIRLTAAIIIVIAGIALPGCASDSGTSSPRGQGGEYTRYVMSLYDDPAITHGPRTIEFPIHIAAAQIGEASPQPAVLEQLRSARDVFGRVESLPPEEEQPEYAAAHARNRDPVRRLESLAKDQGADYLLIYGATVESRSRPTSLSFIDLFIVGIFVPGTREVEAVARGSAALIDVRTGAVVMSAGSDAKKPGGASAVTESGMREQLAAQAHDESLANLANQLVAAAHRRAAEQAELDEPAPVRVSSTPVIVKK